MSEVFKNFKGSEKKITTTAAHKTWEIPSRLSSSLKVLSYQGEWAKPHLFNIADHGVIVGDVTASTGDDTSKVLYKKLVFDSINHLYYDGADNPYSVFCNNDPSLNTRDINGYCNIISLPSGLYGEKIKPGSFYYTSSELVIRDDGRGNLFDPNDGSGSAAAVFETSSLMYLPISDAYRHFDKMPDTTTTIKSVVTTSLKLESNGDYKVRAYNMSFFDDGKSYGPHAIFHGSMSFQPSHSIGNPSDNSVIEIENTKNWECPDHFGISLYVKAPTSQSVTSSYFGNRDNTREDKRFTLKSSSQNVIFTSREWWSHNCPFELIIVNSSHTDKGKVQFYTKSKTNGEPGVTAKSTTRINDGTWHHIFIACHNDSVKLYIDGTLESTKTYSYKNKNTRLNENIHIGVRPLSYKTKYWDQGEQKFRKVKSNRNYIQPFSGSIDQFRFYDLTQEDSDDSITFTAADIRNISASMNQTNRIGNIFYEHGITTITNPKNQKPYLGDSYITTWPKTDAWIKFQGTHLIKEHLYICNVMDGEFNSTYNPTARINYDVRNDNLQSYTTHSQFNPYVTTIGLYNDNHELCAIGKLAQPIKNHDDYDNTFQVRFDTTI